MKDNNNSNEMMSSIIDERSVYYTTVLSHFISRDGKQMVCGLKSGKLALFHIFDILKQNIDFDNNSFEDIRKDLLEPIRRPQKIVETSSPVYSLAETNDKTFICGSKGKQLMSFNLNIRQIYINLKFR